MTIVTVRKNRGKYPKFQVTKKNVNRGVIFQTCSSDSSLKGSDFLSLPAVSKKQEIKGNIPNGTQRQTYLIGLTIPYFMQIRITILFLDIH